MVRLPVLPAALLTSVVLSAACASAGKRLEQGMEAEASGSFYAAAIRYIEALEKDGDLLEARERLEEAGDSAVAVGVAQAEADVALGDAIRAGEEYLALDGLINRARTVGVRLRTPADYAQRRRDAFDEAIVDLMEEGAEATDRGAWGEGRSAYARIRRDFSPSSTQRAASEDAESELLIFWAEDEEARERFRRAFLDQESRTGTADLSLIEPNRIDHALDHRV